METDKDHWLAMLRADVGSARADAQDKSARAAAGQFLPWSLFADCGLPCHPSRFSQKRRASPPNHFTDATRRNHASHGRAPLKFDDIRLRPAVVKPSPV